jgi:hypothetical protein
MVSKEGRAFSLNWDMIRLCSIVLQLCTIRDDRWIAVQYAPGVTRGCRWEFGLWPRKKSDACMFFQISIDKERSGDGRLPECLSGEQTPISWQLDKITQRVALANRYEQYGH